MFHRLVRTSSFRLALTYAAITVTTFLALFAAVYIIAGNAVDHQIRLGIEAEFNNILTEAKEATQPELVQEIQERATVNGLSFLYSLRDDTGHRLAGNTDEIQSIAGWQNLALPHNASTGDNDHDLLVFGGFLPDGSFLAVGD